MIDTFVIVRANWLFLFSSPQSQLLLVDYRGTSESHEPSSIRFVVFLARSLWLIRLLFFLCLTSSRNECTVDACVANQLLHRDCLLQ